MHAELVSEETGERHQLPDDAEERGPALAAEANTDVTDKVLTVRCLLCRNLQRCLLVNFSPF